MAHENENEKEKEKKWISSSDLKKHNKEDYLWLSIHGRVYNVTHWAHHHPGGSTPLLNLTGNDVTDAFLAFHPSSAWSHLHQFFTGYHLSDYHISPISKDYRTLSAKFTSSGLFERKDHNVVFSLLSISLLLLLCVYSVLYTQGLLVHVLSGALLSFTWMQIAYLGHDSGHYNIMATTKLNKAAQILTGNYLTGISIAWWKWTHNAHHVSCNSLDYDPDLQHLPMLAVSSKLFHSLRSCFYHRDLIFDPLSRFFISYQHFTFYPVMCVARVNLYLQTSLLLFSGRKVPDRALNILGIFIFWTWFPLLVSCLPNWTERMLFVLASFCVCAIQHVQFCLNHFAASVYVGPPEGKLVPEAD